MNKTPAYAAMLENKDNKGGRMNEGHMDFDAHTYIRILIAIAKSDPDNGPPEFNFVRKKAIKFGIDYEEYLKSTNKSYSFDNKKVSRLTALMILRDAIALASLDKNFSLPERQRVFTYAEKLDISRTDVEKLENLVKESRQLADRWKQLVASH